MHRSTVDVAKASCLQVGLSSIVWKALQRAATTPTADDGCIQRAACCNAGRREFGVEPYWWFE